MKFPRNPNGAAQRAEYERSIGIPDREASSDSRQPCDMDLRGVGGGHWRIEPRLGYVSCRLIDAESGAVVMCGTLKQIHRHLSRETVRRLGARNYQ